MSVNLSSHLYDLMLETERLRERLGVEKYTHYLCDAIDRLLERYHREPQRCYQEVAKLLMCEWNVDGVFIEQPGELSLCIGTRGDEDDPQVLEAVSVIGEKVQQEAKPSQSVASGELTEVFTEWLAAPLFCDHDDGARLVCVIGVYRLRPRANPSKERRRYHRYQPSLQSEDFDQEDRQLIVETRERLAQRNAGALLKLGNSILIRCSDLTGVDNFLVTQLVRRDDLEIHLGTKLTRQILRDPDYQNKLSPRCKVIGHLFCDIVGFSAYTRANRDKPEQVMRMLNAYFASAQAVLERHPNAMLDKYIGDCLVILIGAFDPHCGEADEALLLHKQQIEQYTQTGVELGCELIAAAQSLGQQVSVGFHVGPSLLGFVGPETNRGPGPRRVDFTAISDHMNIAARLQGEARPSEIVVSAEVESILRESGEARFGNGREVELKNIGKQKVFGLQVV